MSSLLITACGSAPKPIPFSATRSLVANSPALAELETQIAAKKAQQDKLEDNARAIAEKLAASPQNDSLVKERDRLEKENALCQAELAALIGRHQFESARILKRPDLAEHEKAVQKLDEKVVDSRKALVGGN